MKSKPKDMAAALAKYGRRGDTVLAHITPKEAMMLHKATDGGSINPKTGLLEFWDSDPGGANAGGMDSGVSSDGTSTGEGSAPDSGGGYGGGDGGPGYGGMYDASPMGPAANSANAPTGQAMSQGVGGYDYAGSPASWGQRAATGFFNFVNPFGINVQPNLDPRGTRSSNATFSPFGMLGGLAGLGMGVPGLGKLTGMVGPQYAMSGKGVPQDAAPDFGDQWRAQQQARALMG